MPRIHEMDGYRTALRSLIACEDKSVPPSRWRKSKAALQNIVTHFTKARREVSYAYPSNQPLPVLNWDSARVIKKVVAAFRDMHNYDIDYHEGAMAVLHRIDALELYGDRMHRLFNAVGNNIVKTTALIMAQNHGLTAEIINEAIDHPEKQGWPIVRLAPWYTEMAQFIQPEQLNVYKQAISAVATTPPRSDPPCVG